VLEKLNLRLLLAPDRSDEGGRWAGRRPYQGGRSRRVCRWPVRDLQELCYTTLAHRRRAPRSRGEIRRFSAAALGGNNAVLAAKAATTTIPIVFDVGEDPVKLGLVASLARPGGNLTGINFFTVELAAKRLELLRELVPGATRIAVLVDPVGVTTTESTLRDVEAAARAMRLQIQVINASTSREIEAAFASFVAERPDALFVGISPFFIERRVQLAQLAARHAVSAIYQDRLHAEVGGLISYGASLTDACRQVGIYTGRILKGAKPADLPVVQPSKFELVVNHPTARMLGLDVPPTLLSRADEVIE
jgi:putative tryptophan/tyrosine transport system substrate-binding protein